MIVSLTTWPYVFPGHWSLPWSSCKDPDRRTEVNRKVKHPLGSLPRIFRKEVSSTVYEVTKKTNKETDNQNKFWFDILKLKMPQKIDDDVNIL